MKNSTQENAYLSKSVLLEESGTPVIYRLLSFFSLFIFIALVIWSIITKVDEVAIASGTIIPTGFVHEIQAQDGGTIAEILIQEGEFAKKGDVLLRLDPLVSKTQLEQTRSKLEGLKMQRVRLDAIINDRKPDFTKFKNPEKIRDQQRLYDQHKIADKTSREVIDTQIEQSIASIDELNLRIQKLKTKKMFLEEEIEIRRGLVEKGLNSKMLFLSLQQKLSDLEGELELFPATRLKLEKKVEELRVRLEEKKSNLLKTTVAELASVNSEIDQVENIIQRDEQSFKDTNVVAPVDGFINGLQMKTIGGVVSRGKTLLEVVPQDRQFIAEVKISSKDIGHVKAGLTATVKFTTYDFMRYGGLEGKLIKIAPASMIDEGGEPYYKGIVELEKNHFGSDPRSTPILPGMTVTADIKTGSKSIFEYILKPIFVSAKQAMRER